MSIVVDGSEFNLPLVLIVIIRSRLKTVTICQASFHDPQTKCSHISAPSAAILPNISSVADAGPEEITCQKLSSAFPGSSHRKGMKRYPRPAIFCHRSYPDSDSPDTRQS